MTADPYTRLDAVSLLGALAHGTDGATYDLGSWRLAPAGESSSPAVPHLPRHRSRTFRSPSPTGPPSSPWRCPSSGLRVASQASGPQSGPAYTDLRSRRDETGPG